MTDRFQAGAEQLAGAVRFEPTVRAMLAAASTGEVGDGKIFMLPVEKLYRIRTSEEDEAAVTPVVVKERAEEFEVW